MKPEMNDEPRKQSEQSTKLTSAEESLPKRLWNFYRRVLEFPANSLKLERKLGMVGYFVTLALACVAIGWKLTGTRSTYTEVQMETSNEIVNYTSPDVIICPTNDNKVNGFFLVSHRGHRTLRISHNVRLDSWSLEQLGMTEQDLNSLIEIVYESCQEGSACVEMTEACPEKFQKYCKAIKSSVYIPELAILEREYLMGRKIYESGLPDAVAAETMTLELLWKCLLDVTFLPFFGMRKTTDFESLVPIQGNTRKRSILPIWISKSYCGWIPGSFIGDTGENQFRINGRSWEKLPFDYWVGNIHSQQVNSFFRSSRLDITGNIVSENLELTLTEITDLTTTAYMEKLTIRGVNSTVLNRERSSSTRYFYKPFIAFDQASPLAILFGLEPGMRTGTYLRLTVVSRRKMVKRSSLSSYSQFQLVAGIISCSVGHSVMQLLYITLEKLSSVLKIKPATKTVLGLFGITGLLISTVWLAVIDFNMYLDSRFTLEYSERPVPIPELEFHTGNFVPYSFINVTKVREYNVSLEFYAYLKTVFFNGYPFQDVPFRFVPHTWKLMPDNEDDLGAQTIEFPEWFLKKVETHSSGEIAERNVTSLVRGFRVPSESIESEKILRGLMYDFWTCNSCHKTLLSDPPINNLDWGFVMNISEQLKKESVRLSKAMGLRHEAKVSSIAEFFLLNPARLLKHCSIGGKEFDCKNYTRIFYKPFTGCGTDFEIERSELLHLALQLQKSGIARSIGGIDNALKVSIDTLELREHSNWIPYHGPKWQDYWKPIISWYLEEGRTWKLQTPERGSPELKISTNKDWISEKPIPLTADGLLSAGTTVIDLKYVRFQETINRPKKQCKAAKSVCEHPKKVITEIFRSVLLHQKCECIESFSLEMRYREILEKIVGSQSQICTTSRLMECHTEKLRIVSALANQTDNDYDTRLKLSHELNFFHGITPPNNWETWIQSVRMNNRSVLNSVILNFDTFETSVKDRLISFIVECTKEPCLKETFELVGLIHKPPTDDFMNITVYASDPIGPGSIETDRFQLAQFIGVLSCSYGFTFGIGLIGLIEILLTGMKLFEGRPKLVSRVMRQHLMKNFQIFPRIKKSNKVNINSEPISMVVLDSDTEKEHSTSSGLPSDAFESVGPCHNMGPGKNTISRSSEEMEQIAVTFEKGKDNKPVLAWVEDHEKSDSSQSQNCYEMLMLGMLIISTLGMAITVFNFFSTLNDGEQDASVVYQPLIQKPSIFLCANSAENAELLWEELSHSTCMKKDNVSCGRFFRTFCKLREDRLCFLYDNTRSPEEIMDSKYADFRMALPPVTFDIFFAIDTLSSNSLQTVNLERNWAAEFKSIRLAYSVSIMKYMFDCSTALQSRPISRCPSNYTNVSNICRIGEGDSFEPVYHNTSCSRFKIQFSATEHSFVHEKSGRKKYFVVQPIQDLAVVTTIRPKFDFLTLASIVGGYIGTFVELTLFNGVSFIFLIIFASWKRFGRNRS